MERVQRVQKWVGIHHGDCTSQHSRSRKCEHSTNGGTGFGKPIRHNLRFIHCPGFICENCAQNCLCTTGIQQWGRSQKLTFGGTLSLLQSFKGGTNGSPESIVTLWHIGSQFYWKWALIHCTHPPALTATKCKVCQCAGKLLNLYSMLQESSEMSSCFEIQKWMWTCAVTCCADCIRLLAGRGKNIWHQVWSLRTIIPIQCTRNTNSCCSLET